MNCKELYNIINSVAPFALSKAYCDAYHGYDNSGIQLDCGKEITRVLFSLDLSKAAVEEAKRVGADCIVTHHPAIFTPLSSLQAEGSGAQILSCAQAGISVISAHLNLDVAPDGIDEGLMHGLGGAEALAFMHTVDGGAYGRAYTRKACRLDEFAAEIGQTFHTARVLCYGNRPVHKIVSFCGAGFDYGSIVFALMQGADTLVSSDAKHHLIAEAVEKGLNVVLLTHYAAESYGFTRFAEKIQKSINGACSVYVDGRLL